MIGQPGQGHGTSAFILSSHHMFYVFDSLHLVINCYDSFESFLFCQFNVNAVISLHCNGFLQIAAQHCGL